MSPRVPFSTLQLGLDQPRLEPAELLESTVREVMEERGAKVAEQQYERIAIIDWLRRVPELRGPVDLDRFSFQVEPLYSQRALEDAEQVHMKASQVGWSTGTIRQGLFHADVRQRTVIYTFPTDKDLAEFSRKRIKPIIRASEHLMSRMRGESVDNVGQKQIGWNGWIHFRGLNKPIESLDADVVIFDEYDSSDQENIEASERRVTGPMAAGIIRRLGVPSIPGFGISVRYEDSDQRAWTVKCDGCGSWNPIRGLEAFERNVDQEREILVCGDCRQPLDIRAGEWVAMFPDRGVRGYHAPKLLVPTRRVLHGVIENSKKTRPDQRQAWFNYDLGEAYAPAEGRLSRDQVRSNCRPELHLLEGLATLRAPVTMGVDVASSRALNVVIEEGLDHGGGYTIGRKVFVGEVEDEPGGRTAFHVLETLMGAFGVHMCCIDAGPERRLAQAFADRFPGRVYLVSFFEPAGTAKKSPEPWRIDDSERFVSLHRTIAYDATFERFRKQQALIPVFDELPGEYPEHLGNLYRQATEQDNGNIKVRYVRTGPEDYAQSEAYNFCAIELFHRNAGLQQITNAGPQPLADELDFARVDLDWGSDPSYEPGTFGE